MVGLGRAGEMAVAFCFADTMQICRADDTRI